MVRRWPDGCFYVHSKGNHTMKNLIYRVVLASTLIAVPAVALAGAGRAGAATGTAATSVASAAKAKGPARRADRVAEKADDADKRDERHADRVAEFDTDKDGKLSEAERTAARTAMIDKRFTALDTDKSGSLSKAEFTVAADKMHARMGEMRGRGHDKGRGKGHMRHGDDGDEAAAATTKPAK